MKKKVREEKEEEIVKRGVDKEDWKRKREGKRRKLNKEKRVNERVDKQEWKRMRK